MTEETTTNEWLFDVTLTAGEPVDTVANYVGDTVGKLSAAAVIVWFSTSELITQLKRYSRLRRAR